ncbi:hypothetical protein E2C01_057449 [Portunus trituberculatus]|uniref:Uncharacterized protein n=1 Tax=Portunus trituberculatus TaxID=210409 RepID=A0A5B7GSW9_PORTR|nr:hypothetical protein [Portunus trituberculatus]
MNPLWLQLRQGNGDVHAAYWVLTVFGGGPGRCTLFLSLPGRDPSATDCLPHTPPPEIFPEKNN